MVQSGTVAKLRLRDKSYSNVGITFQDNEDLELIIIIKKSINKTQNKLNSIFSFVPKSVRFS